MDLIPCLRCRKQYDRTRGHVHFCRDCARAHDRERARERAKERIERAKSLIESTPSAAEWVPDLDEERLEEIGLATEAGDPSLVLDRMPPGANTPAGPWEGVSTFFDDLEEELDELKDKAMAHPWWSDNPHCFYEVHDQAKAARYLYNVGLRCDDKRGTFAGYLRHRRAGEMACPDCAEANRARSREIYIAKKSLTS